MSARVSRAIVRASPELTCEESGDLGEAAPRLTRRQDSRAIAHALVELLLKRELHVIGERIVLVITKGIAQDAEDPLRRAAVRGVAQDLAAEEAERRNVARLFDAAPERLVIERVVPLLVDPLTARLDLLHVGEVLRDLRLEVREPVRQRVLHEREDRQGVDTCRRQRPAAN